LSRVGEGRVLAIQGLARDALENSGRFGTFCLQWRCGGLLSEVQPNIGIAPREEPVNERQLLTDKKEVGIINASYKAKSLPHSSQRQVGSLSPVPGEQDADCPTGHVIVQLSPFSPLAEQLLLKAGVDTPMITEHNKAETITAFFMKESSILVADQLPHL